MSTDTETTVGENPFAEAFAPAPEPLELTAWSEGPSPFMETPTPNESLEETALAEAFDTLRDEAFDEALADLVAETEAVVADRFDAESTGAALERERLGRTHLDPVAFEAERYVDTLAEGLATVDVASLTDEQFEQLLDRLDPQLSPLSPAAEQFIGGLVRKAKSAVKFVVNTAKGAAQAVGKVAGTLLGPVLAKLKVLIRPLLQRVLSFAIGRLPAPLQAPARALATRLRFEAEAELEGETFAESEEEDAEGGSSPTVGSSPEALAEQFDLALAEASVTAGENEELEGFGPERDSFEESSELEQLAEARGALISSIQQAGEGEDLAPAIENFVPALLAALRVGINLVGRPRVVGFLAKYVSALVRPFVGAALAAPLSTAIVDTGLRMVTLEAEDGEDRESAGPVALAATVEDTVRRLAENEDYVLENDELLQLAAADAFQHAVATNFPTRFVKTSLQQAPSLGGSFVTRRPRAVHAFRRYTRVPEVALTEPVADALRTFGGTTVGAVLRAAGVRFPLTAKVHIFEAVTGTTLAALAAADRRLSRAANGRGAARMLHPLTPHAAGLLLREPRLGARVPRGYLASRGRVAVGQRFYWLEPVGAAAAAVAAAGMPVTTPAAWGAAAGAAGAGGIRSALPPRAARGPRPSQARLGIDLRSGTLRIAVYLSEQDAQAVSAAIRQGRGTPVLLAALTRTFRTLRFGAGDRSVVIRREAPLSEDLSASMFAKLAPGAIGALRRKVRGWYFTQIAEWAKTRAEEFARAAAAPDDGVTVVLTLSSVPGMSLISAAVTGTLNPADLARLTSGAGLQGTPSGAVTVHPGRRLRWTRS